MENYIAKILEREDLYFSDLISDFIGSNLKQDKEYNERKTEFQSQNSKVDNDLNSSTENIPVVENSATENIPLVENSTTENMPRDEITNNQNEVLSNSSSSFFSSDKDTLSDCLLHN